MTLPLPPLALLASLLVVGCAGIVRGYAGFGFSALSVAGLTLFLPPAKVVPPIFMLEVLASFSLLRSAVPDIDWRWLGWLIAGNALALPLGTLVLAWVPEAPLRLVIGGLLALGAVLLRRGISLGLAPTAPARLGVGLVSGFVNGVAAIGGIAVAVLLATSQMAPAVMRATLIALFLFTDLYALAASAVVSTHAPTALLGTDTWRWALWLAPAMLLGIQVGRRWFSGVSAERFRRRVLDLLIAIASISVLRSVLDVIA
ncbi:MAG: sulfite exporter TauE/SafE family protein [Proteobacteria bacterium]|nr:sulfite exporter TauE/SafE family protein [Pseudomonadota bacterium]